MNADTESYRTIKRVGSWARVLIWIQIVLLPLVVLAPYLVNSKTISIKQLMGDAAINVGFALTIIAILVVKGEPLRHPENIPVSEIRHNTMLLGYFIMVLAVIDLVTNGRVGFLWILFVFIDLKAALVAKKLEKTGVQYLSR